MGRLFSRAGYRTQMIGKWHCGDQPAFLPTNHGFDHYFGLPYSNDMGRQVSEPGVVAAPDYPPLPLLLDDQVIEEQPDQASLTERYVSEAVRFLRRVGEAPFLLYLAHLYVHLPIYVQARFAQASHNGVYGAAVEAIDWTTAVLVRELRQLGLQNRTIVIFTSDNGSREGSNLPLRGGKGTTWEGGMRVPCVVRWTGHIRAGRTTNELATAMDLFPTLARLCGTDVPTDRTIDGRDISALLFDEAANSPHEAFYYYFMKDLEAVRSGQWKLHFSKHRTTVNELYDVVTDIGETTNLAPEYPEVVAEIARVAETARQSLGDARLGRIGDDVRPVGSVDDPVTLTTFDPEHPYYAAEYDLSDRG
jgi:arylsulfatase A-like enzyme